MSDKRRALGRGLGALIPSTPAVGTRPVDVFFPESPGRSPESRTAPAPERRPDPWPDRDAGSATSTGLDESGAPIARSAPAVTQEADGADGGPGANPEGSEAVVEGRDREDPSSDEAGSVDGARSLGTELPDATAPDDDGLAPVPGATFAELTVSDIRPNPRQPRTVFDEDEMDELVHSIREIGVLQPIVVRPVSGTDDGPHYELIMGERRWRASEGAGRETIPAIIKDTHDDDLLRDALLENLHRAQLNPLEEAAAYQQLLDDFGCTQEELASRLGRSRPQVSNTLRLLRLPPLVARRVAAGVLSAGHARALLALPDAAAMERLAQRIVAEGLSVRSVEEIVALGGEEESPARRRPRPGGRLPQLDDLAARLSDRLDTRVAIALGQRKGRLTVEFASVEDLHRILGTMHLPTEE
ncbi:putative ParB-like protein [Nostocoides japonicum T1-X7]|uniref:Putative ParB-like protein n=1 Tax=Nostocoides japonicum T1-X7 TaxID=1194083 RepID=A0A077M1J8_9MICO|nr:ParB/RepB/Spo0J family partition protein [Tetrasphaera japonica]CCH80168.1 putative ParB-like protein [Tetrasphaera japonica T1-X7]